MQELADRVSKKHCRAAGAGAVAGGGQLAPEASAGAAPAVPRAGGSRGGEVNKKRKKPVKKLGPVKGNGGRSLAPEASAGAAPAVLGAPG